MNWIGAIFMSIVCVLICAGGAYLAIALDSDAAKHPVLASLTFAPIAAISVFMSLSIGGIL